MLTHDADINVEFSSNDLLKMMMRCAVNDETTLQCIRFLVSRDAWVADSEALRAAIAENSIELASYLLNEEFSEDDVTCYCWIEITWVYGNDIACKKDDRGKRVTDITIKQT